MSRREFERWAKLQHAGQDFSVKWKTLEGKTFQSDWMDFQESCKLYDTLADSISVVQVEQIYAPLSDFFGGAKLVSRCTKKVLDLGIFGRMVL